MIHFSDKQVISSVFLESITKCDDYCPNCHKILRLDRNIFCPAQCLCHANSSPNKTLSIFVAHGNWKIYPQTDSCKLCKSEMPGSVWQWMLVAVAKRAYLLFSCRKDDWSEPLWHWYGNSLEHLLYHRNSSSDKMMLIGMGEMGKLFLNCCLQVKEE